MKYIVDIDALKDCLDMLGGLRAKTIIMSRLAR